MCWAGEPGEPGMPGVERGQIWTCKRTGREAVIVDCVNTVVCYMFDGTTRSDECKAFFNIFERV